jgi:hypothetical protein
MTPLSVLALYGQVRAGAFILAFAPWSYAMALSAGLNPFRPR